MDGKISDFQKMQHNLAVRKGWIYDRIPEGGPFSLLWSIDELGEAIAIIKKKGSDAIMNNPDVRAHFTEEVCDVFMYLFDMMECYGITADEFTRAYIAKYEHNSGRTWDENEIMYAKAPYDSIWFAQDFLPDERLAELIMRSGAECHIVTSDPDSLSDRLQSIFSDTGKLMFDTEFPEVGERVVSVGNEEDMNALRTKFGIKAYSR